MNRLLRKPFRLQYASNLFVHKGAENPATLLKTGVAPNLALLGNTVGVETAADCWASREFLSFCADNWKRTLLVPAYSELGYTGVTPALWTDLLEELRGVVEDVNRESSGKIYLVDQSIVEFPEGVRVLGFTGWSAWSRQATSPAETEMPTVSLGTLHGQDLAKEDMEWLGREFHWDSDTPTVLVSHGLSTSSLVKPGLPDLAYRLSDLMAFYPYAFFFSKERCIKACLGGAGVGGTLSGFFQGTFHAVNARKAYPAQLLASPGYRRDAFFEYSWRDHAEGNVRELVEAYARAIPIPNRAPVPALPKFEASMA
jgi:hypothetical protein